jgi:ribosome recycling factor
MIEDLMNDATSRMRKAIDSLKHELSKIRSGRAHPSLLEHVTVQYYGNSVPLSQAANIHVEDARTLTVTAWDKTMIQAIEKAIMTSDLGLNPATTGTVIRVPLPALTEDRRRELVKVVKAEAENARVAVRNIRRDTNTSIKDLLKEKEITEDEDKRAQERVQKLTDKTIDEIDQIVVTKEKDLMSI